MIRKKIQNFQSRPILNSRFILSGPLQN